MTIGLRRREAGGAMCLVRGIVAMTVVGLHGTNQRCMFAHLIVLPYAQPMSHSANLYAVLYATPALQRK